MKPPLRITRIDVSPETLQEFEALRERFGTTSISAASRLAKWIASQPKEIQEAVLTVCSDRSDEITRQILEHLASKKTSD